MIAPINKIIPLSLVDGPGNRTSIFLQGCNISCAYCHNPETQRLCNNCGECVEGCPVNALSIIDGKVNWNPEKCVNCDQCIKVCPNYASPKIKYMSAEEVFEIVKKNIPFIRGITVSGGECTLYPDFLLELFKLAKAENLSCLIDSNGMVDFSKYPDLIKICDGVMLDVKAWDTLVYKKLTGKDNKNVKLNIKYLSDLDKIEEIRIVCLPDEMDADEVIQGIADTIKDKVKTTKLKLIKFRRYGVKGRLGNTVSPTDNYMEKLLNKALTLGFKKVSIT